jgi:hypothetical protein
MPRLPHNPNRDFSASPRDEKFDADVAELFASTPPVVGEFFADPIAGMRIGTLIARAMSRPTRPQRRDKSR